MLIASSGPRGNPVRREPPHQQTPPHEHTANVFLKGPFSNSFEGAVGRSVSPAPAWRRGHPTAKHRTGRGAAKECWPPLLVHLGARGGGRPLTAPPAWCQDPLAMCACSRENNPAPNLATLLQGTASTPAVVIDSSPSPGGRGHGRAPDPTRRPPRTQNGPTRRADTRAGNQRDRIAVQGVAADPSA